jgi:hypothetical protein
LTFNAVEFDHHISTIRDVVSACASPQRCTSPKRPRAR